MSGEEELDVTTRFDESVDASAPKPPEYIGRYRVERRIGSGGFGLVFLASDEQLLRRVAIKVPHSRLIVQATDAEAYLAEARTVANLDHPHIVPVYDVGGYSGCPCYIVSKYIDGTDLSSRLRHSRLSLSETVELVATVADALHYAHKQGVIHRDVKPGNILLDRSGTPFVADFGLALREEEVGQGPRFAGTPAYMSPEQVRSEGHRVDGRSDIFSLGVMLYEMLLERRPFRGQTREELLDQIVHRDAPPLRQVDDLIPKELERICLKALSKRAIDRYTTARDLAEDLRDWIATVPDTVTIRLNGKQSTETAEFAVPTTHTAEVKLESRSISIVPKGLRSFDEHDADFFLELLPGPRDRDGLPESVRFWKTRIESVDLDATFAVGMIYGPSGCGKSSLVKAGLLPRLSKAVAHVYVEATSDDTELRLLRGLRRQVPRLPTGYRLVELLAALRQGQFLDAGQKVLLVIDQFEQWLHARQIDDNEELVQALRQCDGVRLQAVVMVRDDFWLPVSRFMQSLEVRVVEGENSRLADLFDRRHARKVLVAMGKALGCLPSAGQVRDHEGFVDQAIEGLSQEDKVISVRLALFAEMMKSKPWTLASLREAGGPEGVGVAFLEETFSGSTAPPQHRMHQKAAQAVLRALLPETGSAIKGMRSRQELLDASDYAHRPNDFETVLRILDSELRLITPTDPEGATPEGTSPVEAAEGQKYYQLTHDYLVTSLRDWLTRKRKDTRQGTMELLLEERTGLWTIRQERKQLPAFGEWLSILRFTRRSSWTTASATMMKVAGSFYTRRILTGVAVAALIGFMAAAGASIIQQREAVSRIDHLVDNLWNVRIEHVPDVLVSLAPDRPKWEERARSVVDVLVNPPAKRARAALALCGADSSYVPVLVDRISECEADEHAVIRSELSRWMKEATQEGWSRVEGGHLKGTELIRMAALLAQFSPESNQWQDAGADLVDALVSSNPFQVKPWIDDLFPVRDQLLPCLKAICIDRDADAMPRSIAASTIAAFGRMDPSFPREAELSELLLSVDDETRKALHETMRHRRADILPLLIQEADGDLKRKDGSGTPIDHGRIVKAVTLTQNLGYSSAFWRHLNAESDPRVRTQLIDDFARMKLSWSEIQEKLLGQPARVRQAIVLGLPQGMKDFSDGEQTEVKARILDLYRTDPDGGVHSAAEMTLRSLGQDDVVATELKRMAAARTQIGNWRVLSNGLCMIAFERPGKVLFTPASDSAAEKSVEIDYPFEISSTEITLRQFRQFKPDCIPAYVVTPSEDCPMSKVDLFSAMRFCRWLSEQEPGFDKDQCVYPPVEQTGPGLVLAPDYQRWPGFRLPNIHEWEYATRAGSLTECFFGDNDKYLDSYCWWVGNAEEHLWPVGLKRPNSFGLFDTYGNVFEWCHTAGVSFDSKLQQMRGGNYSASQRFLNSAVDVSVDSEKNTSTMGFRIVWIKPGMR